MFNFVYIWTATLHIYMAAKNLAIASFMILAFVFAATVSAANFVANDVVQVVNTGNGLKVRDNYCLSGNWDGTKKFDGSRGSALSGPVWCGDGYYWWKIRWDNGREGWSADGDKTTAWLTKVFVSASTKFSYNDKVQTTSNVNARNGPPELAYLYTVSSGAQGIVIGGPFYGVPKASSGFYHFWQVNFAGTSDWFAEDFLSKVTTSTPSAPQNLGASVGDGYVDLWWSAPSSDGGSPISYYKLYRGTYSGGETYYTTVYGTSFTNTLVTNGVTYYYKVTAVNGVGESSFSNEASATPKTTVQLPDPPALVSPSDGAVLTTTTPVFSWNSVSGADQYGLYVRNTDTNALVFDSERDGYTITGSSFNIPSGILQNNGNYRWNMRSHNSAGWGTTFSTVRTFSISVSQLPTPPTHLSPADGSTISTTTLTFTWNPGSLVQYYGLYVRNVDTGLIVYENENIFGSSFTLPSGILQNGNYRWNMRSFNIAGASSYTTAWTFSVSTSTSTRPSPPQNLAAAGSDKRIDLSWTAPTSNGGSSVSGYNVYRGTASGQETFLTSTALGYADVVGLTNGVTYYYKLTAYNTIGESDFSNEASATPQSTAIGPPERISPADVSTVTTTTPTFIWNSVSGADKYYISILNSDYSQVYGDYVTGTSFTLPSGYVQNGMLYRWHMQSVYGSSGSDWTSFWSFIVNIQSTTVPSSPQNLVATAGDSKADISWSAPSSNGGSAVTNYKIYRGTVSNAETLYFTTSTAGTTFSNTNLQNGITYFYKVSAVNNIGESSLSNEASATPQSSVQNKLTPELLAAIRATLEKEVSGSYLPVEEYGDYGMGPGCTYKIKGKCRSTPYDGGVDYKGRGYIQITHKSNYQAYCGSDCISTSAPNMNVCGCKNSAYCTVKDETICPMIKALQPVKAGQIFANYYRGKTNSAGQNIITLSNTKSYYTVGLLINGGSSYANDFQKKANSYLTTLQKYPTKTTSLMNCATGITTSGCGPSVFPEFFTYSASVNQNLYGALSNIGRAL